MRRKNFMKEHFKTMLIRCILLFIGLTIAHLGVTLFLLTNLGSDPFNVLVQGIFHTLSGIPGLSFLTHGRTHIAICFLIILLLLVVDRTYIKIGTFLCMLFGGPIIDFFTMLLLPLFAHIRALPLKLLMLVLGCIILAFGMTIVIKSEAGTGPNDLVSIALSDKLHIKFSIVRILTDALFVLTGFLLGGAVGIGTIVCVFLIGPVAGFFLPISEKIVQHLPVLKAESSSQFLRRSP